MIDRHSSHVDEAGSGHTTARSRARRRQLEPLNRRPSRQTVEERLLGMPVIIRIGHVGNRNETMLKLVLWAR